MSLGGLILALYTGNQRSIQGSLQEGIRFVGKHIRKKGLSQLKYLIGSLRYVFLHVLHPIL